MTKSTVLQAQGLVKTYREGDQSLQVLNKVDLTIRQGEMVAIVGASGSGKSTLLHALGLLDLPTQGEVLLNEAPTTHLSETRRSQLRNRHLGFVYQFHHLLPEFTALENVAMPLVVRRNNRHQALARAQELLAQVGLEQRAQHFPSQLSGGERQRVALARALVSEPDCVLADEPTGNLDSETAMAMFDLLVEMNRRLATAFVIVTHDMKLAALADRQLRMQGGKID